MCQYRATKGDVTEAPSDLSCSAAYPIKLCRVFNFYFYVSVGQVQLIGPLLCLKVGIYINTLLNVGSCGTASHDFEEC